MMTTTIKITEEVLSTPSKSDFVQYLPCTIMTSGSTEVEERFNKFTEADDKDSELLTNSLRGYPLEGRKLPLPEGYTGLVVEGGKTSLTSQDRDVRATASFKEMTYWNYDRKPSENDAYQQAMQWLEVAKVLHEDQENQ